MTKEEAIEKLEILKEDYWDDDGYGHESKLYDDTVVALDMAINALEERKTEWHPYPQEKPKVDGEYNVTLKYGKCTAPAYYETENDEWRSVNGFYVPNRCITAWAELPKPYKEGSEEDGLHTV